MLAGASTLPPNGASTKSQVFDTMIWIQADTLVETMITDSYGRCDSLPRRQEGQHPRNESSSIPGCIRYDEYRSNVDPPYTGGKANYNAYFSVPDTTRGPFQVTVRAIIEPTFVVCEARRLTTEGCSASDTMTLGRGGSATYRADWHPIGHATSCRVELVRTHQQTSNEQGPMLSGPQPCQPRSVVIHVVDDRGAPMLASVVLVGTRLVAHTNRDGFAMFMGLPLGRAEVGVRTPGWNRLDLDAVVDSSTCDTVEAKLSRANLKTIVN